MCYNSGMRLRDVHIPGTHCGDIEDFEVTKLEYAHKLEVQVTQ